MLGEQDHMNEEITTIALDEAGNGLTNWARLHAMTDEENEANIASDFDSWPLDDQARGYFFHVHPTDDGRWTWDMVDRDSRVVARAPTTYASWDEGEAATLPLRDSLKAA